MGHENKVNRYFNDNDISKISYSQFVAKAIITTIRHTVDVMWLLLMYLCDPVTWSFEL